MNLGQFNISYQSSITLLKLLKLFKGLGLKPIGQHSDEIKKISKKNRHKDIYDLVIKNMDYEIILVDDSIFQFSFNPSVRYAFIQNPIEFVSKENYLSELLTPDELMSFNEEELDILLNTINEDDYEQFLNEQEINMRSNFIRYDASSLGYKPLLHSYSHIHIGMNENLRIPSSRIITPHCFVMFCIKNTYYNYWKDALDKISDFQDRINESKLSCKPLNNVFWNINEEFELFLK